MIPGMVLRCSALRKVEAPFRITSPLERQGVSTLWEGWVDCLNSPSACLDVNRQRPWPPYPGYEVAFGAIWPKPVKRYSLDLSELETAGARRIATKERTAWPISI